MNTSIPIPENSTPATTMEWNRLPKRFVVQSVLATVFKAVFLWFPMLFGVSWIVGWSYSIEIKAMIPFLAWIASGILVLSVVYSIFEVPRRCFALTTLDMTYRYGLFARTEIVIPFSRIQAVASYNSTLGRLFRVSTLQIVQVNDNTKLRGLDFQTVATVREYIALRVFDIAKRHNAQQLESLKDDDQRDETLNNNLHDNTPLALSALVGTVDPSWSRYKCLGFELFGSVVLAVLVVPILLGFGGGVAWELLDLSWNSAAIPFFGILGSLWIALSTLTILYPCLEVPRRGYALRKTDLSMTRGVISKKREVWPLTNIQHVTKSSRFVERKFNFSNLLVYVAGAGTTLYRLEKAEAEKLREQILDRARKYNSDLDNGKNKQHDHKA
ncbi:MAG: PH domain-containing protein [Gammaproteobacteria bacterium]|nr:PH domain-containing protein [Gammaproteobacteria bacterium]